MPRRHDDTTARQGQRRVASSCRVGLVLAAILLLSPLAAAHGGADDSYEDQLLKDGEKLVVGKFTAPQPGPLVVVPFVEDPPACAASPSVGTTIAMGKDSAVTFYVSAQGLHALFDLPPDPNGYYTAFAVDTHDASRALILMMEEAVALHALEAVRVKEGNETVRSGVLGLPYELPTEGGHAFNITPEGGGILMDHDGSFSGATVCSGDVPGHRTFSFNASKLPDSVTPGRIVHVVALYDPKVPEFLPRPVDGSTRVLQLNLYLARPGENATAVRAAFSPTWSAADLVPIGLAAVGTLAAIVVPSRTRLRSR